MRTFVQDLPRDNLVAQLVAYEKYTRFDLKKSTLAGVGVGAKIKSMHKHVIFCVQTVYMCDFICQKYA